MIKEYFDNKDTTLFALHSGITRAAVEIGSVFGPIYLYQNGFDLWLVFAIYAFQHALRIPCRWLAVPLINRVGVRKAQIIGAFGFSVSFLILPFVKGIDGWLWTHIALFVAFQPVFWICYHLTYMIYGETAKRGRQIALKVVLDDIGKATLPIIAGLLITFGNYFWYYGFAFVMTLIGFIPLWHASPVNLEKIDRKDFKPKTFRTNYPLFLLWAMKDTILVQGWYFVLVIMGTDNLIEFGGYVALGIAAKSLLTMVMGHFIDKGKLNGLNNAALGLYSVSSLMRSFIPLNVFGIVSTEGVTSLAFIIRNIMGSSTAYNFGKGHDRTQAFWYWMVLEGAWDIGVTTAGLIMAVGLFAGIPLRLLILVSIPFAFAWWLYMRRHVV